MASPTLFLDWMTATLELSPRCVARCSHAPRYRAEGGGCAVARWSQRMLQLQEEPHSYKKERSPKLCLVTHTG